MKHFFFFQYALKSMRKNAFPRFLTTVVCGIAVAFTAMSSGYLSQYIADQDEYIKNISERELIVYNNVSIDNPYNDQNLPISANAVNCITQIDGIQVVSPLVHLFSQTTGLNSLIISDALSKEEQKAEYQKQETSEISWETRSGEKGSKSFEVSIGDNYSVVSYSSLEIMDKRAIFLDDTVQDGCYITEGLAQRLEINPEELVSGMLNIDVWVTPVIQESAVTVTDDVDGHVSTYKDRMCFPWTQKATISVPVRGVVINTALPQEGDLFLSSDRLIEEIRNAPGYQKEVERFMDYTKQKNPDADISEFFDWSPNAYYVIVESAENIPEIKEEILAVDPNLEVIYYYQNFDSTREISVNNRNVMMYISLSVLTVVLLLMALIYIGLIDKRKFEFALLRANGMTKKEVRKVIYAEMVLQLVEIFAVGIIAASVIFWIGRNVLGYLFQYDGMTILWLFIISLGAIVLPTLISLIFVNRFEPDRIMRN